MEPRNEEAPSGPDAKGKREVRHEYTRNFPRILEHLGASLLVSTYQAGKVVVVGIGPGGLELSYHNFEKAMGIAVRPGQVAVGARAAIWILSDDPAIARLIEPAGKHEACFLRAPSVIHRRDPGARTGVAGRRAMGRQHGLLVPLHA